MKRLKLLLTISMASFGCFSQLPEVVTCWQINTIDLGFAGELSNVQAVNYSDNYVYVTTEDIPSWIPAGYDWPSNPWFAEAMGYTFKITRNPVPNSGQITTTGYGHIGIWKNGCSIYNPKDAKSYQDSLTWFQNAWYWEHLLGETFDACIGHPNGSGEYHTHVSPTCLYNIEDSTVHSPLIGYAFDGYPIYGAYGYTNGSSGAVKGMKSSYRLRNITDRTVLSNGTVLPSIHYGPSLDSVPLGGYMEDYEFLQGLGDLDIHNGKTCITPEYPDGTYAYFVTLDWVDDVYGYNLKPVFPYVIGTTYYGNVVGSDGNTGPNSGFVVISEPVTPYTGTTTASLTEVEENLVIDLFPNPTAGQLNFELKGADFSKTYTGTIYTNKGDKVDTGEVVAGKVYSYDAGKLANGTYYFKIVTEKQTYSYKFIVSK